MDSYTVKFKKYMSDSGYNIKIDLDVFNNLLDSVDGFAFNTNESGYRIYYLNLKGYRIALSSKMVQVLHELGCTDIVDVLEEFPSHDIKYNLSEYDLEFVGLVGGLESLKIYIKDVIYSIDNDL